MSFENISDIEQVLRSNSPSVRDLHAAWEQRLPIPDTARKKSAGSLGSDKQIAWLQDISIGRLFTKHAVEQEEFLLAMDAAQEILRLPPANAKDVSERLRVRMDYAAALTRMGNTSQAREELEPCLSDAKSQGRNLRVDILLQLGDIAREESYHAATKAEQHNAALRALGFYQSALDEDRERLAALVRTAAASLTLSESGEASRGESEQVARHILSATKKDEDESGPHLETSEARATAHAVLGDLNAAMRSFESLRNLEGVGTSQLAEARFRAQFLAESLGKPRDFFKPAFPALQLIVFSGHLPDQPGGRTRLPPGSIGAVRDAMRAHLSLLQARVGLVSASAGADLLFIEALRERQGGVHIVLPWEQEEFRRTSVQKFDPKGGPKYWEPLYDKALGEAATIRTIGQAYEPGSDIGWEYMMEVTAGIALQIARASRLDIKPMVLWDGLPGNGRAAPILFTSSGGTS